ncbi:MAG: RDD family protein [Thiohalocapsa sp.]|nr:RDD family protein [Thiohalocapsa sp.]
MSLPATPIAARTAIDTLRRIETPEGADIALRLAGPVPRAAAFALDALLRLGAYLLLTPLIAASELGLGLLLLMLFAIEWLYPVLFEISRGATPGKLALGLRVVHDDATPVAGPASLLRNLLRVVDFLPLFYAAGLVCTLIDRDFRRLGDLAAGTLVVYADPPPRRASIPQRPPRRPPRPLDAETQRAILDFAERSNRLGPQRSAELAELIADDPHAGGGAALEQVLGMANWAARGR